MRSHIQPIIAQYLNPSSGNYTFQLIIAGILVVLVFFSKKIKSVVANFSKKKKDEAGS